MSLDKIELRPTHFKIQLARQIELENWIEEHFPASRAIYEKTAHIHHSMPVWQCMMLAAIGSWFNYEGANILEIGSAKGGSAAIWCESAPLALVSCLEPADRFQPYLAKVRSFYGNLEIRQAYSWDWLRCVIGDPYVRRYDLVFVDGNHVLVHRDLPWWNYLRVNGLMFFDDYTPHIYPAVCAATRDMWEGFGRTGPDISIRRVDKAGMVGLWKRSEDEVWPDTSLI